MPTPPSCLLHVFRRVLKELLQASHPQGAPCGEPQHMHPECCHTHILKQKNIQTLKNDFTPDDTHGDLA